jgi:hypothetical protein
MTVRRRSSCKRNPPKLKAASPDQIRAQLKQDYIARQTEWTLSLEASRVDWAYLLGLHLQMIEIEHLSQSLEEFS